MGETDLHAAGPVQDAIRSVFTFLDKPAYWLLTIVYQLFFNVATATIISNSTVLKFYNRVQIVLGVYMLFQLALIIIKGIVNPDDFTKSGGSTSKLVIRIVTVLLIFSTLIPMTGINPRNELEKQIHDNGILFGTLYSLQNRILSNNTLGKLILGTSGNTSDYWNDSSSSSNELKTSANMFASSVLKGFYRINLIPESERVKRSKPDDRYQDNWICRNMDNKILDEYKKQDVDPQTIISMVTETCDIGNWFQKIPIINFFAGTKRYVFAYMPVVSTVVAIIFVFILASFTVDVAVRSIKLAILRLIAPIPLVSYLDPKGSKDGSFNAWVKTLTSTYLDLFIRLSVILFVIFIIQDTIANGIVIRSGDGLLGHISLIIIWIALFIFAKQAPNFLRQALGAKDGGKFSMFGGLGEIVGAAGAIGGTALGTIASMRSNRQASRAADEKNGKDPNTFLNRGKHLLAGMAGGVAGLTTGVGAAMSAKDHAGRAAMDAINKRNARVRELGGQGSTFLGGVGASLRQIATGQTGYDVMEAEFAKEEKAIKKEQDALKLKQDALKTREDTLRVNQANNNRRKGLMDYSNSKAADSKDTVGTYDGITGNYRNYHSTFEAARTGVGVYSDYISADGTVIDEGQYQSLQRQYEASRSQFTMAQSEFSRAKLELDAAQSQYQNNQSEENRNRVNQAKAKLKSAEDNLTTAKSKANSDSGELSKYKKNKSYFDFEGQKIDMQKALTIDQELLKSNGKDYYQRAVNDTTFDRHITNEREDYRNENGHDLEDNFDDMKSTFHRNDRDLAIEASAISREKRDIAGVSQDLSNRSIDLNNRRNDAKAKAAKANAERFKSGK